MANKIVIEYEVSAGVAVSATNSVSDALNRQKLAASQAAKGLSEVKGSLKRMTDEAKKSTGAVGKLAASIKRVVFYRAIRSAIRAVTQSFREGISNLYQYSAALNSLDAARAKNTMDGFATTALYVKNSLGAALMPILQSLLPIVNSIADAFVTAANAVNQFWSAIQGKSVFTRAKKQATEFGEALGGAAGKAKELKKQIFGFDELNIFNEPSSGGGGSNSGLDYEEMFEESKLSALFERIKRTVQNNLGKDFIGRFKINWKSIISDWSGLTGEDVAKKILTGFYALMGGVTGFTFGGVPGAVVGTLFGTTLGIVFSTIIFDGDGEVSDMEIANAVKNVALTLTGGVVGFAVGGAKGALLGMTVAASLDALITTFSPKPGATEMTAGFIALLIGVMKTLVNGKGIAIGAGASIGAPALACGIAIVGGLLLTVASLVDLKSSMKDKVQFIGTAIAEIVTLIAGGIILVAFLGPGAAAAFGISILCGLNLLVNNVFVDYTPQSKRELEMGVNTITATAQANMNAYMKFGTPDYGKGAIGRAKGKANGGFVETGTYFYAGEAGPELVGQVGGRTNVTNQDQFTAGMEDIMDNTNTVIMQAAQALISAIQNKDMTAVVSIGDRQIVSAYDRGKRLAGVGLVE